ncbi:MAG: ribosome recycling factor [Paludibacteraceae bacterium]|nr:ribosome recycling factor [Paludibacteraceae bacterium]MEE3483567.1 ribosome recycling factor [Bacteroidales bacterium]
MDENKTLDKIIAALKIAEKEFLEKKAANNETIILSDKDGKIIEVPAKDFVRESR